jgi:hypothetical protein
MGVPIRMRQVLELEEDESSVSQLLIEAALVGEEATVDDALAHKLVDVNYRGTVSLRVKYSDTVQQEEAPDQVKIEYEEFKTDVTPLFAAAHAGHINITRKLLVISFSAPKMETFSLVVEIPKPCVCVCVFFSIDEKDPSRHVVCNSQLISSCNEICELPRIL